MRRALGGIGMWSMRSIARWSHSHANGPNPAIPSGKLRWLRRFAIDVYAVSINTCTRGAGQEVRNDTPMVQDCSSPTSDCALFGDRGLYRLRVPAMNWTAAWTKKNYIWPVSETRHAYIMYRYLRAMARRRALRGVAYEDTLNRSLVWKRRSEGWRQDKP